MKTKKVGSVKKAKSVSKPINKVSANEIFKSLSGKTFSSKEVYLESKLKRDKSKFSLGHKVFSALISKGAKKATVDVKKEMGIDYLAPALIMNKRKGYLGLIKGGDNYRIENPVVKNLSKGDSSNGTSNGIVRFDLVKI